MRSHHRWRDEEEPSNNREEEEDRQEDRNKTDKRLLYNASTQHQQPLPDQSYSKTTGVRERIKRCDAQINQEVTIKVVEDNTEHLGG